MAVYFNIGRFAGAHGIRGELVLRHELGKKTSLKGLKTIFIEEKKNSFLPWFIETSKVKSANEVLVKLEGVATREEAIKLARKEVWLTAEDRKKFSAKSSPLNLLGYSIVNRGNPLGEIQEIVEQAHQMVCKIEVQGKEVLIPLNGSTLLKIDHKKKEVVVDLPEGLLEVYMG